MVWSLIACRCHSGAEPIKSEAPNLRAVGTQALQDAIQEYESELQDESTEKHSIKGDPVDESEGPTDSHQGGWVGEHGNEVDGLHEFEGEEEEGMQAEDGFETTNEGGGDGSEGEDHFENPPVSSLF